MSASLCPRLTWGPCNSRDCYTVMRGFRPSGSFAQGGAHSLQSWSLPRARRRIRAQNAEAPGLSAPLPERLVRLTLPRPLGIVFGENGPGGEIVVEELVAEGNAKRSGKVFVGDKLIRCSATVLKSGNDYVSAKEGYGDRPYDNWEVVMFDCRGEDFNTVMSALGSNNPRWGINEITIELQRGGEDAGGAEEP